LDTEFQEIGHSGGKITFSFTTNEDGDQSYQPKYTSSRPVPVEIIGIWALTQGIPIGSFNFVALEPPCPGCYPVYVASDSEGKFGHTCPSCKGYWRSGPWPNLCPYCSIKAEGFQFLSESQLQYVRHYCETLSNALRSRSSEEVIIDMDVVADAVGKELLKPSFYVSEKSQQYKFKCNTCGEFNDILGHFGYCSLCGTRNDLNIFENETLAIIREDLNNNKLPEDCLKNIVSSFDSFVGQYAKQLNELVPLSSRRKRRLSTQRFHNLSEVHNTFKNYFDIDLFEGVKDTDIDFVKRMFHRRHIYEHNGGEVDQKYLDDSGDKSVKLKQKIRENKEDMHRFISCILKIASNIHNGFHDLFPPKQG
jgi:hypothetical protein